MESNTWCPRLTAAMILSGSLVQIKGFGLALVSAMKPWIAFLSSWTERKTPRLRRRLERSANKPSTALSQDAEVGVKWRTKRGWRASHCRTLGCLCAPGSSEGDITLKVRNANYTLGPVMLHIGMKPGAVIPAHLHKGMAEALYVVEGDFTNEGKQYQAGTSLHFKAGKAHGPHSTKNGCKLLVLWTERTSKEAADLSDFIIAQKAA